MKSFDEMIKETIPEFYMKPNVIYRFNVSDEETIQEYDAVVLISKGPFDGQLVFITSTVLRSWNGGANISLCEKRNIGRFQDIFGGDDCVVSTVAFYHPSPRLYPSALRVMRDNSLSAEAIVGLGGYIADMFINGDVNLPYDGCSAFRCRTNIPFSRYDLAAEVGCSAGLRRTNIKLIGDWKNIEGEDCSSQNVSRDLIMPEKYIIKKFCCCSLVYPKRRGHAIV